MLKHRIIPVLLTSEAQQCVKPHQFQLPFRVLGPMLQYTKNMERRNVDEIIIADITATRDGRVISDIHNYISELFCPITVGGGIKTPQQASDLIRGGADKIVINSGMWNFEGNKGEGVFTDLIKKCALRHGAQAVTVALDVHDNHCTAIHNGERLLLGNNFYVEDIAKAAQEEGAGEIFLTTMDNEGTFNGYDLKTIEKVAKKVTIPIIAHGGCGTPEHMAQALNAGASAVAAGSMFLFTEHTPRTCAQYLHDAGFAVRVQ